MRPRYLSPRATRLALVVANLIAMALLSIIVSDPPRWQPPDGHPLSIVTAVAQRHAHGERDGESKPDELSRIALGRPVETTCSYVSLWAIDLLEQRGYDARLVSTLTLDEWNYRDDGHTLLAVRVDDRWMVVDIDRGVRFTDRAGRPLSLAEWVERVPTDDYEILPIEADAVPAEDLYPWYRRVAQVPLIHDGYGRAWFWSEDPDRVASYDPDYIALSRLEWHQRFYD